MYDKCRGIGSVGGMCMCVHTHTYIMYVRICIGTDDRCQGLSCMSMYVGICMCVCMYGHMYLCVYVYVCV